MGYGRDGQTAARGPHVALDELLCGPKKSHVNNLKKLISVEERDWVRFSH